MPLETTMPLSTLLRPPTARPYCYVVSLLAALLCAQAANAQIRAESESNDRESTADGPIGSGVVVTGTFSSSRDIDWFYVDMPSSGTISISLDHASGRDFDWALYQATGGAVTSGRSSRIPETGTFPAATTGRYYLKLTSHSGSGPYTLRVDLPSSGGGGTGVGTRPTKPGNLQNWLVGNAADSGRSPVNGPGLILMGGGLDVDASFSQRAFPIANGGDVVVIRTSGTNGYNDYLFNLASGALKPDSVETLLLDTREKANSDYAEWTLRNAELIFIAGGDQSSYLNAWKDTRSEDAIRAAYLRGAVIGGTSAGLAVQGEHIYDPDGVTAVTSAEAVANPYRSGMLFSTLFLDLPLMGDIITDTHFSQRDRMGRLLAFMARLRQDGNAPRIVGVGVSENTAIFLDRDGRGIVDGSGSAYVIEETADTQRTQVANGQPLVYRNLRRTRLVAGQTFDFVSGQTTGSAIILSVDGRNAATPLTPQNAY
jgi:cyanophycinase